MLIEKEIIQKSAATAATAPPVFPASSTELVNLLSHYYRGEMARMMSWRDRLDRTTNWAITVVAAMLSVSLSTPSAHHGVLLFAMLLVYLLLVIESRRYRFFHVYRSRVRLMERSYYARIFSPQEVVDHSHWMSQLGEDLRAPRFTISLNQAMSRRLRRNYFWMYLILLLAWLLKTTAAMLQMSDSQVKFIHSPAEFLLNASIVGIPGWAVFTGILLFYGWLFYIMLRYRKLEGELIYGEVHV
jgi:uncharacterized membrane protein